MKVASLSKHIVVSAMATVLFAVGLLPAAASADDTSGGDIIWCGLWAGANLDLPTNDACLNSNGQTSAGTSNVPPNGSSPVPSTPTTGAPVYAALGDSVAAGLGLPQNSSAIPQDTQCGRSPQSYPYLVANALGYQLTDKACSGATAGDLVTQQHIPGPNPGAQLDAAFVSGTPKLITITAGANDVHWADFIRACYAADCTQPAYQTAATAYMSALRLKLNYVFNSIQSRSNGTPPPVLITSYYNPLSMNCNSQQQNLTPAELDWLSRATNALNRTVQLASNDFSFVRYVPLVNFAGHDICSATPWVQGLNDPAPLHPTAAGQQAIANDILQTLNR